MSNTIITNAKTGKNVPNENLALDLGNGILVKNKECIKFIPEADLMREKTAEAGTYSDNEEAPLLTGFESNTNSYTEKAVYKFGLENLEFLKVQYDKTSAIISSPVDVSEAECITLEVAEGKKLDSEAEYYILDETLNETAILPTGQSKIEMEKLFYGLPTRFLIDSAKGVPILYEDGRPSSKNYLTLEFDDYNGHEYCLSYYPYTENAYRYKPYSDTIRLKIIIRNYTDIFSPVVINDIKIRLWKDTENDEQD